MISIFGIPFSGTFNCFGSMIRKNLPTSCEVICLIRIKIW